MARNKPDWNKKPIKTRFDLWKILRGFYQRFSGLFHQLPEYQAKPYVGVILFLCGVLLVWLVSGFYFVAGSDHGVVMKMGRFVGITQPGPHWNYPRPFGLVYKVNIRKKHTVDIGGSHLMPTADGQLIDADFLVNYVVKNPVSWIFNIHDPQVVIHQISEEKIRQSIAKMTVSSLSNGHAQVLSTIKSSLQLAVDADHTGIEITRVTENRVAPPAKIASAYADINQATRDSASEISKSQKKISSELAKVKLEALQVVSKARLNQDQTINDAKSQADQFNQMLGIYEKHPALTREKLYLDAMKTIIGSADKVIIRTGHHHENFCFIRHDGPIAGRAKKNLSILGKSGPSDELHKAKNSGLIEDHVTVLQNELRSRNRPERP
ncbi:MAG: FtsH protease activity modulator HflK [Pseudomonadota bacterium]|nr:FtsH protease activity modulator HflK [Pseudomonadota bacterium]